ncbi:MAG: hypothetical protein ABIR91_00445 [Candidatus Saccharimonadales bacterium]
MLYELDDQIEPDPLTLAIARDMNNRYGHRVTDRILRETIERGAIQSAVNRAIWLWNHYYISTDVLKLRTLDKFVDDFASEYRPLLRLWDLRSTRIRIRS